MGAAGISYFPLDCKMSKGMELIEAEFGITGFGVVVHLWQEIYAGRGYYAEWDSEVALLFSCKVGVGVNVVLEIVKSALRRGIFDSQLFEEEGILTSKGIQKRYFEIVARRKKVSAISEYLLVSPADFCKDVNIFSKNVNISDKNANIFQQRKGKEKKEKKNIQNRPAKPQARKCAYGSFENVLLSDEELSKLQAKFSDWQERIEELSEGLESKGYKYKSHYATILAWDRREKGKRTSVEEQKAIPACWKED